MNKIIFPAVAVVGVVLAGAAEAREQIRIVGSSTVFPFASAVAEQFGKTSRFPTPVIESTGSGGGIKLFCAGIGAQFPDVANSSRKIKKSELEGCAANGVNDVTEIKIGFDGIVLANSKKAPRLDLTRKQIFLALAREVPVDGKIVPNPYKTWAQIDPKLPNERIEVLGPPPTSGTRDAFVELVMEYAADQFPEIKALAASDAKRHKQVAGAVREDGHFVEAGENDMLIVRKIEANKAAFGIFGYSFLDQNADVIQGNLVDGAEPTFENIAADKYPVSRSLYMYVKNAHVTAVPGIREYVGEFTSDKSWGPDGYLADKGLIPMGEAERKDTAARLKALFATN